MNDANNTENVDGKAAARRRLYPRELSLAISLALSAIIALALSYGLIRALSGSSLDRRTGTNVTAPNLEFSFLDQPAQLPEIRFVDGDAKPLSLHDFSGRPVLLNIWATWCVPCRKEMPSLDRLQAKFDPSRFLVLTLSIDHQGIPAVTKFYQELGLKSLGVYVDRSGAVLNQLHAPGLPTTVLVDANGREVGRKIGPTEWDSPQTVALLRQRLKLPAAGSGASQ
jgi:thiol-disulfide isomerase/thioredoxin